MPWERLGAWWIEELTSDPAYEEEIAPQLLGLLAPERGRTYLDLGCGNGRMMSKVAAAGARVVGCDVNLGLLRQSKAPVVKAVLPDLSWVRSGSFDGAYLGLVLEHLADEEALFKSASGAVRQRGVLALVINHPIWTAPGSSPIEQEDGEVLWRPGRYFGRGHSDEPAGRQKVRFYHRTLASLLTSAAIAGWDLQRVEEAGISPAAVARTPAYVGQEEIPRLLGLRWLRRTP
ncbi:MAG TPA: methyltransferase domain-containing protein [Acidimicrobiia bacterium]|jgi:SAM-dependent methyltransferase|nr:methyltransferase domain-containing protein [Acidimicrobiia bacterium]